VSGDRGFADAFFDRFIQGGGIVDYGPLLARAGLLLRKSRPGRAWMGPVSLNFAQGPARVDEATVEGTPAYTAGLDRGDEILVFDGSALVSPGRLE
jgi:predicted metalloprotease with PDZ domain